MGYNMSMNDSDIYITSGVKKEALKALKKAFRDYTGLQSMRILEDAMADYGYVPEIDDDYNIVGVEHVYKKLGDDEIFWNTLAPYVKDGSFIEMIGEDNEMWRWSFQNGKMTEQTAKITWRNR